MGTQRAVSARRVHASRVNGAKSNGPVTEAGKERASRNRLCHGFFSRHVLLPGEDAAELEALRQELMEDVRPRGCVEKLLVERLVTAHWKLARLQQAEHRMIQECTGEDRKPKPAAELLSRMIYCGTESDRISVYQNRLEGTIHRCMRELRYLRKQESVERRAMSDEEGDKPTAAAPVDADEVRKSASVHGLAQPPHPSPLPAGEGAGQGNRRDEKMRFEPNETAVGIPGDGGKDYNSDLCRTG